MLSASASVRLSVRPWRHGVLLPPEWVQAGRGMLAVLARAFHFVFFVGQIFVGQVGNGRRWALEILYIETLNRVQLNSLSVCLSFCLYV
jgi:hypothetical protein